MNQLSHGSAWRALLEGPVRQRAVAAVEEIAGRLAWPPTNDCSLAEGSAGQALFRAYLAEHCDSDADREAAVALAADALAASVGASEHNLSLFNGVTGAAWVLAHLDGWILDLADGDPCDAVDHALLNVLQEGCWKYDYDLVSGLVGIAVYAMERLAHPTARACVAATVTLLVDLAEAPGPGQLTWPTPPASLLDLQPFAAADGRYNLGVAHGVPGVVAVLADARAAGIARDMSAGLLDGAVMWLLANRLPPGQGSSFPSWVGPGTSPGPARSAWCYGDPGVAAVLHRAGRSVGNSSWTKEALAVACGAAVRPEADDGVVDAGLCHGAAGLAHIYNRLWQATGADEFAEAARRWIDRGLELLPETGAVGFLEGAAGIGLVLLGALGIEPAWDRVVLLSAPAAGW